jgi:hypothetical protein
MVDALKRLQAETASALDALLAPVPGRGAGTLALPPSNQPAGPVELEISRFLAPGENRVEIRAPGGSARASAELVATHYEPWREAQGPQAGEGVRGAAAGGAGGAGPWILARRKPRCMTKSLAASPPSAWGFAARACCSPKSACPPARRSLAKRSNAPRRIPIHA